MASRFTLDGYFYFLKIVKYYFLYNYYCRINFLTNAFGPSMRKVFAVDD